MLTVSLKSGRTLKFNLRAFVREQAFKDAWYSMKDDEKYSGKRLVGHNTAGKGFNFCITEIENVDFLASEYVEGTIHECTHTGR